MARLSKQMTTAILIAVSVLGVYTVKNSQGSRTNFFGKVSERAKGNPRAPVKIKEYIDFQCPACAEGAKFLTAYMQANPQKIYLELKFFPLTNHKHGLTSSRYVYCAGQQKKFWPFHDLLIERQRQWSGLGDVHPFFQGIAQEVGLDKQKLEECLLDDATEKEILEDKAEGQGLGVQRTPTYFVNGNMVVGYKSLIDEIDLNTAEMPTLPSENAKSLTNKEPPVQ